MMEATYSEKEDKLFSFEGRTEEDAFLFTSNRFQKNAIPVSEMVLSGRDYIPVTVTQRSRTDGQTAQRLLTWYRIFGIVSLIGIAIVPLSQKTWRQMLLHRLRQIMAH